MITASKAIRRIAGSAASRRSTGVQRRIVSAQAGMLEPRGQILRRPRSKNPTRRPVRCLKLILLEVGELENPRA